MLFLCVCSFWLATDGSFNPFSTPEGLYIVGYPFNICVASSLQITGTGTKKLQLDDFFGYSFSHFKKLVMKARNPPKTNFKIFCGKINIINLKNDFFLQIQNSANIFADLIKEIDNTRTVFKLAL